MRSVVDRAVSALDPPDADVLAEALAGSADRARHDALAARVPALDVVALSPPPAPAPVPPAIRVAAWNAERLKRVDAAAALLDRAGADVALLSEVDLGMARSGNRHAAADLAAPRGAGFAYGVEFVELGLGDAREVAWHAGETNASGFHGNAILSRFRLADPSGFEPLFADMARAGFGWRGANTAAVTSRTRPDGAPLPPFTRIDWLFVRGAAARDAATLPATDAEGVAISDHDLVAATVAPAAAA